MAAGWARGLVVGFLVAVAACAPTRRVSIPPPGPVSLTPSATAAGLALRAKALPEVPGFDRFPDTHVGLGFGNIDSAPRVDHADPAALRADGFVVSYTAGYGNGSDGIEVHLYAFKGAVGAAAYCQSLETSLIARVQPGGDTSVARSTTVPGGLSYTTVEESVPEGGIVFSRGSTCVQMFAGSLPQGAAHAASEVEPLGPQQYALLG